MLELIHDVVQDFVAHECQAADDIENSANLSGRKPNIVAILVKEGETAQSAEYDGTALQGWNKIFVDQAAKVLEPGHDSFVPALVPLS